MARSAPLLAPPPSPPRVSIGLPVFNGANYLQLAIDSILNQSFTDFELVIADNASTDATPRIIKEAASRDSRVKPIFGTENIGAAPNYTRVFENSFGEYFKWASHDDVCSPHLLEKTVAALDSNPKLTVAAARTDTIDQDGKFLFAYEPLAGFTSDDPAVRLETVFKLSGDIYYVWGLMRRHMLEETGLLGSFIGHDRALLANLAMVGPFWCSKDILFHMREHEDRSIHRHSWRDPEQSMNWYDPSAKQAGKQPTLRLFREYVASLTRAKLSPSDSIRCALVMKDWCKTQAPSLRNELSDVLSSKAFPASLLAPLIAPSKYRLERLMPPGSKIILIDDEKAELLMLRGRSFLPFLERDGRYYGPPPDEATAITELERMRSEGAEFVLLAWTSFWWQDIYPDLFSYMKVNCAEIYKDKNFRAFKL